MPKGKSSIAAFLGAHPLLGVFILTTICFLPTVLLRDVTPANELRYLSIADEAIANGSVFTFSNHGIPYADKPPLYLWLVILCRRLFGSHCIPFLCLFSYIPAIVTVTLMDRMAGRGRGPWERASLALVLMSSALFLVIDIFLRMDVLMVMFIVAALYYFLRMYREEGNMKVNSLLFPLFIFLALFTKGPVGILVPVVSVLLFLLVRGEGRRIGKFLGWKTWTVLAVLCAVWFSLTYAEGGKEYLDNLLFHQTMGRAVNSFAHDEPLLFYFPAILYTTIPWSLLLAGTSLASLFRKTPGSSRTPQESLFLCVVISTFVMLSLFSGKLPVYLAPIIPFMVWLLPLYLDRVGPWKERGKWMRWFLFLPLAALTLLGGWLCYVLISAKTGGVDAVVAKYSVESWRVYLEVFTGHFVPSILGFGLFTVGMAVASVTSFSSRSLTAPFVSGSSAMLLLVFFLGLETLSLNPLFGYRDLCGAVPEGTEVATVYIRRPENMDVFLGKSPTDFAKNPEAFIQEERNGKDYTLLTVTDKIPRSEALQEFISGRTSFTVGRYTVVPALSAGQGPIGPGLEQTAGEDPVPQSHEPENTQ